MSFSTSSSVNLSPLVDYNWRRLLRDIGGGVVDVLERTASTLSRKNVAKSFAESSSESCVLPFPKTPLNVRHSFFISPPLETISDFQYRLHFSLYSIVKVFICSDQYFTKTWQAFGVLCFYDSRCIILPLQTSWRTRGLKPIILYDGCTTRHYVTNSCLIQTVISKA